MDTCLHQRLNEIVTMQPSFRKLLTLGAMLIAIQGMTQNATASPEQQSSASILPELINPSQFKWQKTIPQLGKRSPEYAILHEDKATGLTTLMFRTPVAVHIKPHTHQRAETHVVMVGGTHVFESEGVHYKIENGGFFRAPGGVVHEAWLPAGSQTFNILESGWVVDWLNGGPSAEDIDQYPPKVQ
jgi:quercetin dioxygenase-like cupin family protein